MKKKKLKSLSLKKASVSKLNGGSNVPSPILQTINLRDCVLTQNIYQCGWHSELYTACGCEPSRDISCVTRLNSCKQSIDIPCPI